MLVLSRFPGEKILIGDHITVTVLSVQRNRVRIGIHAPDHVPIVREEVLSRPDDSYEIGGEE